MAAITIIYSRRWGSERLLGEWWTHCGLLCPEDGTILESRWASGVARKTITQYLAKGVHVGYRDIEVPDMPAGQDWARQQIGKYGLRSSEFVEGAILAGGLSRFHGSLRRVSPTQSFKTR